MRTLVLSLLLVAPVPALAKDFDFQDVVEDVEHHLGARRLRIPLWGLIRAAAWPAYRPFGVTSFNMAVLEYVQWRGSEEPPALRNLGPGWRPVLRIRERHGDQVYSYAAEKFKLEGARTPGEIADRVIDGGRQLAEQGLEAAGDAVNKDREKFGSQPLDIH